MKTKDDNFKYWPLLEYLFGDLPEDKNYAELLWPGQGKNAQSKFSQLIHNGKGLEKVKQRIAHLLKLYPLGIAPLKNKATVNRSSAELDKILELPLNQFVALLNDKYNVYSTLSTLERTLELIKTLALKRDKRLPVLWNGISIVLEKTAEIEARDIKTLQSKLIEAVKSSSFMRRHDDMDRAIFMYECRTLTKLEINEKEKEKNSHSQFTAPLSGKRMHWGELPLK